MDWTVTSRNYYIRYEMKERFETHDSSASKTKSQTTTPKLWDSGIETKKASSYATLVFGIHAMGASHSLGKSGEYVAKSRK